MDNDSIPPRSRIPLDPAAERLFLGPFLEPVVDESDEESGFPWDDGAVYDPDYECEAEDD